MSASFLQRIGIRTRQQFRLALRGLLIVLVVCSGYVIGLLVQQGQFWWSAVPFVVLLVATLLEFVLGDYIAEQNYPIETEAKLDLLERQLGVRAVQSISDKLNRIIQSFKACDVGKISGTVHVLITLTPSPEHKDRLGLLQLTHYVGPLGGSKGRITTLDKGIIGRCARTMKQEHVNFSTRSEYLERMVQEFGFSLTEAVLHTTVARSYIAEPLMIGPQLVGVLYFFTTEAQVFPLAAREADLPAKGQDIVELLKTIALV
jgi:hypothetical protein